MKKFLMKAAKLIGIAALLSIIVLFGFYIFMVRSIDAPSGHIGKFTKLDLDTICGVELREREDDLGGVTCMEYWNNRNTPTEFDELRFYVFKSNGQAKRAFNKIKRNYGEGVQEKGKDYFIGEEPGTIDAFCINYFYIHNNLIIETNVECYSDMAWNPDDPSSYPEPYIKDRQAVDSFVRNHF